jgi:hypothetical protein
MLLEVYTCFPLIPLAFLFSSGLSADIASALSLLATQDVTVTGGMNLCRGPWNNPALHGLIAMTHALRERTEPLGVVHGNGGLGYRQGVAILRRS